MKQIPNEFKKQNFEFRLLARRYNVALYMKKRDKIYSYEVHIIRKRKERILDGNVIPAGEYLASNEEFGYYAWSFQDYKLALLKYRYEFLKQKTEQTKYQ